MAFHKSHSARRVWKMNSACRTGGLTSKQFIRMMIEAENYSFGAQLELDKKRSKRKEEAAGGTD